MPEAEKVPKGHWFRVCSMLAIAVLSSAVGNMSQTALNALMPAIVRDFGIGVDLGQWLTTGYMLVIGITMPASTFLAKRFCIRHYLFIGIAFFMAGSLVDYFAASFGIMFAGRILQAISVGLLMPLMQNIVLTQIPPNRRATAMGVGGMAMGVAPNIGPTIGGAMETAFGWRSLFLLTFAISAVLFLSAVVLVRRAEPESRNVRFEIVSFVLSTLGFGGVLLGLSEASSFGLASLYVWVPIAVGAVFLVLFVKRQARLDSPLIDLAILKNKQFDDGLLVLALLYASFMGVTLVIPLYVVNLQGGTSLDAGMVMLPPTIIALVVNPVAGMMSDHFGTRPIALLFAAFLVAGSLMWLCIDEDTPLFMLMAYQTVRAVGISGSIGPLNAWALAKLDRAIVPDGTSASMLIRQASASFGTALMVMAIESTAAAASGLGMPVLPYQLAFGVSAAFSLAMAVVVARRVR